MAEAAGELSVAANTVSTLVGALSRQGLLVRRVSDSDRRVAQLELSGGIRAQIDAWRDRRIVALATAIDGLPGPARTSLLEAMPILADVAERLELGGGAVR